MLWWKMVTKQQLKFAAAGRKASKEGRKPGTKSFGARVKQLLKSKISTRKVKSKPKTATVKKKRRVSNPVAKQKTKTRSKRMSKLECFIKGGFGGAGVGETVGFGAEFAGLPPQLAIPIRVGGAAAGGYYIGNKKLEGLLGGVVFEIIPSLISLFGVGSRGSRLSGL